MGVVEVEREGRGELRVGAGVGEGGEAVVARRGAAGVAEDLRVKGTTAGVPQVAGGGEFEEMKIGAKLDLFGGVVDQLHEAVGVIHHVEEREAGVETGRWQHLEEG